MEQRLMVKRFLGTLLGIAALALSPETVTATSAQPIGNAHILCDNQVASVETRRGIPTYLLKSISLAETGRWDKVRQANVAWPWTVTALGKGNYFPDKASALEFVRFLQANAIFNIDVGCMQVNLYYHGDEFDSLEDAIDPATNVAYAAEFLESLYENTRSWTQAAAHYHSTTPERAQYYKRKVMKYWNQERKNDARQDRKAVDYARMAQLNEARQNKKKGYLNFDSRDGQSSQLAAWKSDSPAVPDMATAAAMRRAAKEAEWREKYRTTKLNKDAFAEKRRKQLDKWRLTRARTGDS